MNQVEKPANINIAAGKIAVAYAMQITNSKSISELVTFCKDILNIIECCDFQ